MIDVPLNRLTLGLLDIHNHAEFNIQSRGDGIGKFYDFFANIASRDFEFPPKQRVKDGENRASLKSLGRF